MITIFLIDDHELVRFAIKALLKDYSDIQVIGETGKGENAVSLVKQLKPDLVLLDIQMPGIGGFETVRRLLRMDTNIKIITLTSCEEKSICEHMLRIGVKSYLTKNNSAYNLVDAIYKVYQGGYYIDPHISKHLIANNNIEEPAQLSLGKLTERELQILWMLTKGQSVHQIASKLFLSSKTINTYRYRLFLKLKVGNDVELVHLALHFGLLEATPISVPL